MREVQIVRTILSPLEASQIIQRHIESTEVEKLGLGKRRANTATVKPLWDDETNDFDGFKVELVFSEED
jgi:hypothetical protein